ncbi:MAG: VOC family protein [Gammaproteobacteria bacterium]|nr:VOC family protein [Gammaproteobacteria bacterium]
MLIAVNHVQITVPEGQEKEAKEFYCNLLGLKEVEKPDVLKPNGGFWMQSGNIQIHVGIESGVDRNQTKAHVAYEVTGIESWRSKLEAENIVVLNSQLIPGFKRFEFRDPFGNRVELLEKMA